MANFWKYVKFCIGLWVWCDYHHGTLAIEMRRWSDGEISLHCLMCAQIAQSSKEELDVLLKGG